MIPAGKQEALSRRMLSLPALTHTNLLSLPTGRRPSGFLLSDCRPAPGGLKMPRRMGHRKHDGQDGGRPHRPIARTVRGQRPLNRARPLCRRSAGGGGNVARNGPALAARSCRDPGDRYGPGIGDAGCQLRRDRRGRPALDPALYRRRQVADRALVYGDRARALSRRAGCRRRRERPLPGRGRARSDRRRIPPAGRGTRSACRRRTRCRQRPAFPLRRPGSRFCRRTAPHRDHHGVPAQ